MENFRKPGERKARLLQRERSPLLLKAVLSQRIIVVERSLAKPRRQEPA